VNSGLFYISSRPNSSIPSGTNVGSVPADSRIAQLESQVQMLLEQVKSREDRLKVFELKETTPKVSITDLPLTTSEPSVFRADVIMANLHD